MASESKQVLFTIGDLLNILIPALAAAGVPVMDIATGLIIRDDERAKAIVALREVCKNYGDNDWPDNLNLADIVNNHLLRHLQVTLGDAQ
jgi:hypothetical protein